jgi:hypothetical protein
MLLLLLLLVVAILFREDTSEGYRITTIDLLDEIIITMKLVNSYLNYSDVLNIPRNITF